MERKELLQFPVVKEIRRKSLSTQFVNSFFILFLCRKCHPYIQSQILGHAQQLHHELERDDKRLSRINHALEQATKEKVSSHQTGG